MFRGFNLELREYIIEDKTFLIKVKKIGFELHADHKKKVRKVLKDFLIGDKALDASKMLENWFPMIKSDIFISHSHRDENTAVILAGWIHENFGLMPFIDSCAWGNSTHLLRLIDKKFCWNRNKKTYSYKKRNFSTSHVHIMLSTALSKMIDKSECIIFLNTPSSITPNDVIDDSNGNTTSPWIYSEIAMTRLIRKRSPDDHRGLVQRTSALSLLENFEILYNLELDHLTALNLDDLNTWWESKSNTGHALDKLYNLKDNL